MFPVTGPSPKGQYPTFGRLKISPKRPSLGFRGGRTDSEGIMDVGETYKG